MNHARTAHPAIYLHNDTPPQRVATRPASSASMATTSRIARAPAPVAVAEPRMATTRIIRRSEFHGIAVEQPRGSRLRARWLAASIGAALPVVAQAVLFRRELLAQWTALAGEAGSALAMCQQAAIGGGIALATVLVCGLIAALQDRSDGRALQLGLAGGAALSLIIGLARVGGMMPASTIPFLALDQAIASPFAVGVIEARAGRRAGDGELAAANARAEEAVAALAAERAARADDAAKAEAARATAVAEATAANQEALSAAAAAPGQIAAARDLAAAARAVSERATAALAAAEATTAALTAERDRAVAAAATNERALAAKGREIDRLGAELERARTAASVQASQAPIAAPAAAPAAPRKAR